tara:strand:+ start:107 stop:640 length:534 start_codon:yes stop_codon:yes gene_type:complete
MNKAQHGLPNHLFKYVSSITPIINVDLIIHNPKKGIILSWRADKYYGPGWHVPGGIIRFKENIIDRLHHVAREEINLNHDLDFSFVTIHQIMNPNRDIRGHFISLLFASKLENPSIDYGDFKENENGYFKWHKELPKNLIKQHKRYEKYIDKIISNGSDNFYDFGNIMDQYSPDNEK